MKPLQIVTLWIAASLLLTTWGCSPKVIMTAESRDTTVTTIENRVRDTLIPVEVPLERIVTITRLDTVFVAQTAIAEVEITPQDKGGYKVDLHHREDAKIEQEIQIPEQRVTTEHHQVITRTEIKEVNVLKWWQQGLIHLGIIALLFLLAKAVVRAVKAYTRLKP